MSTPFVLNAVGRIDRALLRIVAQGRGLEFVTDLYLLGETLQSSCVLRPTGMEKIR